MYNIQARKTNLTKYDKASFLKLLALEGGDLADVGPTHLGAEVGQPHGAVSLEVVLEQDQRIVKVIDTFFKKQIYQKNKLVSLG